MDDKLNLPTSAIQSRAQETLQHLLKKREGDLTLRRLVDTRHLIDFASNDYLGFARSTELKDAVDKAYQQYKDFPEGATGSRLIMGQHELYEQLEKKIASYHSAETALIFNSGYDANVGFFSSVPQPNDVVLFDELVHASIRDGVKMGRAKVVAFVHNDLVDLEEKLQELHTHQEHTGNIYITTESLFSMDGDLAPLTEMIALCKQYGAELIVDEAHATGIFGNKGEGRIAQLGLQDDCFARIHTFGKALGGHGAVVLGSSVLKEFLVNFARSFVYTTALPLHNLLWVKCAYDILPNQQQKVKHIHQLAKTLKQNLNASDNVQLQLQLGSGPIQAVVIPGNERALGVSKALMDGGIYAKAILYPTVPRGGERIRICLHDFNTEDEVVQLCNIINKEAL